MADADSKFYEFEVKMSCGGCSGAVGRVLKKLEGMPPHFSITNTTLPFAAANQPLAIGVKEYSTNLETQKVNVTTVPELDLDTVTATIKKTGKEIVSSKELDTPPAKVVDTEE